MFRIPSRSVRRQSGVVLLFALVLLVILLLASIALVRSSVNSTLAAGNIGFKRDLQMQAGRGIQAAENEFKSGALANAATLNSDLASANYSSSMLPSGPNGIPNMLLDDSSWTMTGSDLSDSTTPITDPTTHKTVTTGITIRYVIDRLCTSSGVITDPSQCVISQLGQDKGGTAWLKKAGGTPQPVYRITVRVLGPHNTQTFVQQLISE
jgi:Tfp pilus assembly protein PilX